VVEERAQDLAAELEAGVAVERDRAERATVADLSQVQGINAETARKIYDFFHGSPV